MCVKPPTIVGGFFIEKNDGFANIMVIRRIDEKTIYMVIR